MHTSQFLAITLSSLGVHDEAFVDELAKYARVAIVADPPDVYRRNALGKEDPAVGHNPTHDAWCAKRLLEFAPCQKLFMSYIMDLEWLTTIQDRRAIPVLQDALGMANSGMVTIAAIGLARLNDVDSIPLIAKACMRFPPSDVELIISNVMNYSDPAVEGLFNRFISDPAKRARILADWKDRHKPKPDTQPDR
jgi:hypothetical protein